MGTITHLQVYRCEATTSRQGLRAWRQANGLTRVQLADHLGYSERAIQMWEEGDRRIPCWMDRAMEEIAAKLAAQKRRPEAARLQHGRIQ